MPPLVGLTAEELTACLAELCCDDATLRAQAEALLRAAELPGVLDDPAASVLARQRPPHLVSQTVCAGGAAAPTLSVQHEEVGIKLGITPLINADGYITTQISPEVSSASFRGGSDLPVGNTRQATTTVGLTAPVSI